MGRKTRRRGRKGIRRGGKGSANIPNNHHKKVAKSKYHPYNRS